MFAAAGISAGKNRVGPGSLGGRGDRTQDLHVFDYGYYIDDRLKIRFLHELTHIISEQSEGRQRIFYLNCGTYDPVRALSADPASRAGHAVWKFATGQFPRFTQSRG